MPEMTVTVRWPDGAVSVLYSPSLVMHDHLDEGARYPVSEFVARSTGALDEASERVRARYGFACSSAAATAAQVREAALGHPSDGPVEVVRMHPPLPAPAEGGA